MRNTPILPSTLKSLRGSKNLSAQALADRAKTSLSTIRRIESSKDVPYRAKANLAEALARSLDVSVAALNEPHLTQGDKETLLRELGYRQVNLRLDGQTLLAIDTVARRYGIPFRAQMLMAPLFAALLAEGSLAWRTKRLNEIDDALRTLTDTPSRHLHFVQDAYRVEEGIWQERDLIAKRALFTAPQAITETDYDPEETNPFAEYLSALLEEIGTDAIQIEPGGQKDGTGIPEYEIDQGWLERMIGSDPAVHYALRMAFVRLKDIPDDLLNSGSIDERRAWILNAVPDEMRGKLDQARKLRLLLNSIVTAPPADPGAQDA